MNIDEKYVSKQDVNQKRFLTWFLTKADPSYMQSDVHLHQMANEYLGVILGSLDQKKTGFKSIKTKAGQEPNHIRVELDEKYVILMQILTAGQPSNESLTKEVNHELTQNETETDHLYPVFLKTKYEFTVDESELIYPILYRKELLDCLFSPSARGVDSDRLIEYRFWLLEADREFSGFRDNVPSTWGYKEWIGYSNFMEKEMNWGAYEFRPDEKGGKFEFFGIESIQKDLTSPKPENQLS